MSTRANIVIKDQYDSLWFYRHSDGYPDGVMPTLKTFMKWLKQGRIRNNASQAAGWLIALGIQEYRNPAELAKHPDWYGEKTFEPGPAKSVSGWKVGAYEPTAGQHGDIEWLYTIDLVKKTLKKKKIY